MSSVEVPRFRHEALGVILQVRPEVAGPRLCVLVRRRPRDPFVGRWALPGGPVETGETIEQCVRREVETRLDLSAMAHTEQLATYSDPGRDPMQRTIGTAYLGLVPADVETCLPDAAGWVPVDALPEMAFDHAAMIADGVARMRAKLSYTNLAFALAPDEFTVATLRDLYSAALGYEVEATNLQRVLTRRGQLVATGERHRSGRTGGRPAAVYRFATRTLEVTDPFATLRPHG